MAQIPSNLFRKWNEGDVVHAVDYQLERDSITQAHNDTDSSLSAVTTRVTQSELNITGMSNALALKTDKLGNHQGTWQGLSPSDFQGGQQALNLAGKEDKVNKGQAGGYASLDGSGNVPQAQLGNVVTNPLQTILYWIF